MSNKFRKLNSPEKCGPNNEEINFFINEFFDEVYGPIEWMIKKDVLETLQFLDKNGYIKSINPNPQYIGIFNCSTIFPKEFKRDEELILWEDIDSLNYHYHGYGDLGPALWCVRKVKQVPKKKYYDQIKNLGVDIWPAINNSLQNNTIPESVIPEDLQKMFRSLFG